MAELLLLFHIYIDVYYFFYYIPYIPDKPYKSEGSKKGIDTQISIDMISKAYENHYDVALLLAGDNDFEPVVNAVKNDAGKNVYGIYFSSSYSENLKYSFDSVYEIKKEEALDFLL